METKPHQRLAKAQLKVGRFMGGCNGGFWVAGDLIVEKESPLNICELAEEESTCDGLKWSEVKG